MSDAFAPDDFPDLPTDRSIWISLRPLPNEAMSSWLLRLCRQHRCTMAQMRKALRLKDHDVDFDWPWSTTSTAAFLACSAADVSTLLSWRHSQIAGTGHESWLLADYRRSIRVCQDCVHIAGTIYYTTRSRLSFVTRCLEHRVDLTEQSADIVGADPADFQIHTTTRRSTRGIKLELEMCVLAQAIPSKAGAHLHPGGCTAQSAQAFAGKYFEGIGAAEKGSSHGVTSTLTEDDCLVFA